MSFPFWLKVWMTCRWHPAYIQHKPYHTWDNHSHINKVHPNLQFTPTFEHKSSTSLLDLIIIRNPIQIEIDIFRKPTNKDNHNQLYIQPSYRTQNGSLAPPDQQDVVATTLKWTENSRMAKKIRTIGNNNKFPIHHVAKLRSQIQRKAHMNTTNNGNNNKWVTFTYHSSKLSKIIYLVKRTDIKMAFKSTKTATTDQNPKSTT
jgi:hypothetical protein